MEKEKKLSTFDLREIAKTLPENLGTDLTAFKLKKIKENMPVWVKSFIKHKKNEDTNHFIAQYNCIKDESWPDCMSINDWYNLPNKIKEECLKQHNFNPINFVKFSDSEYIDNLATIDKNILGYDEKQILSAKNIIIDNMEYIKNSNIIEYAAGDGFLSACAINLGAKSSIVTEISNLNIEFCNKTKEIMDYDNDTLRVIESDITNKQEVQKNCMNKDVVIFRNVLPLFEEKYSILKSVAKESPAYIIISELHDTTIICNNNNNIIINSPIPLIQYFDVNFIINPLTTILLDMDNILVQTQKLLESLTISAPNTAWYDFVLSKFGYSRVKSQLFPSSLSTFDIKNEHVRVYELIH